MVARPVPDDPTPAAVPWLLLACRAGERVGPAGSFRDLPSDVYVFGGSSDRMLRVGGYAAREWHGAPRSELDRRLSGIDRDLMWCWFFDAGDAADRMELMRAGVLRGDEESAG